MGDVYDSDILVWSEQQAELPRRRAANALDWDHLAEEIEDVGRSELRAVESHLVQALRHDLTAMAWPGVARGATLAGGGAGPARRRAGFVHATDGAADRYGGAVSAGAARVAGDD
jgi:Domain of unknown function DUF29